MLQTAQQHCQSRFQVLISPMLSDHSGCDHHHHAASEANNHCYSLPPTPDHDCTCTPQKTYPYVLDDLVIEQKSKNHLLDDGIITSAQIDFNQLSLLLCKSNPSNGPPPLLTNLPQQNSRFTSIYLGVFLIWSSFLLDYLQRLTPHSFLLFRGNFYFIIFRALIAHPSKNFTHESPSWTFITKSSLSSAPLQSLAS